MQLPDEAVGRARFDWPEPVEVLNEGGRAPFVLLCEHASNHIPAEYERLGLDVGELERHIAWDPGAARVTRRLAGRLDAIAFLGTYSRLLIDLNRPPEAESSIPTRSETTDVPGNHGLPAEERERRARRIFHPFHERVRAHLDGRRRAGRTSLLVSIHSFTPVFLGRKRHWHAGVLHARAAGFAAEIIAALGTDRTLRVAANVPYGVSRDGDYAVPVHGDDRGIPAVLIEIRHDLIAGASGVTDWVGRLAAALGVGTRGG